MKNEDFYISIFTISQHDYHHLEVLMRKPC